MTRMQTQFFAHWVHNPTVAGIDIALVGHRGQGVQPAHLALLTGKYRDEIQLYVNTLGPKNWLDKHACRDWADELRADPHGWKVIKFGFEKLLGRGLRAESLSTRLHLDHAHALGFSDDSAGL